VDQPKREYQIQAGPFIFVPNQRIPTRYMGPGGQSFSEADIKKLAYRQGWDYEVIPVPYALDGRADTAGKRSFSQLADE
tara:strand:- start:1491 stop:1727 length:237 start_codon:yes stop_codon:yes gene_type:complete